MLNNLLSIERGGLACSQGDYIPRQSQRVLSCVIKHWLQGQTVKCGSQHKNILTVYNHHRGGGSYLMGCIKHAYSYLIALKRKAVIQSSQLNW